MHASIKIIIDIMRHGVVPYVFTGYPLSLNLSLSLLSQPGGLSGSPTTIVKDD